MQGFLSTKSWRQGWKLHHGKLQRGSLHAGTLEGENWRRGSQRHAKGLRRNSTNRTGTYRRGRWAKKVEGLCQHVGHQLPDEIEVTCTNSDVLCIWVYTCLPCPSTLFWVQEVQKQSSPSFFFMIQQLLSARMAKCSVFWSLNDSSKFATSTPLDVHSTFVAG